MKYLFDSKMTIGNRLPDFSEKQIKNEPMFWQSSGDYAFEHGGPITQAFLRGIGDYKDAIIDTRTHMLMSGWFPCIPGFHHDDVPRSREDGQPNYDTPEYRSRHIMALVNGDICPTEFALGECTMPEVPSGGIVYKEWHPEIERLIKAGELKSVMAPSNRLIHFDCESFHQGTRAVKGGWRWFGRASFNTNTTPKNEIRNQVQVYLEFPMEGW